MFSLQRGHYGFIEQPLYCLVMNPLRPIMEHLRRLITRPIAELTLVQRSLRYLVELVLHCVRQLGQDRAEEMAAALTYRTIFALIPLVVLGLIVFRIFGGMDEIRFDAEHRLFQFLGLPNISYVEDFEGAQLGPVGAGGQEEVRVSIRNALADLAEKVAKLNLTSVGVVGIFLFIYAGMGLAISVERDFNIIFKNRQGRPWGLRIPVYWSMITLGTGLLAVSIYMSGELVRWVEHFGVWGIVINVLSGFLAYLASWILLMVIYTVVPSGRIDLRSALIGSAVAALLWEVTKWAFQIYVHRALPYSALYGSLGLIPLFLLWLYTSWMIVLFGGELTYALQIMRHRRYDRPPEDATVCLNGDPQWLIPMLAQIGIAFDAGKSVRREELAGQMHLPNSVVDDYLKELRKAGLINCVEKDEEGGNGYALARPPEAIRVADVLQLGQKLARPPAHAVTPGWKYLDRLDTLQREAANGATLRTVVSQPDRKAEPAG